MGRRTTNTNSKKRAKYDEEDSMDFNQSNRSESKGIDDFLKFKKIKLSDKQVELFNLIKGNKIIIATGPPGTAKTFCACYAALKLYAKKQCDKIIISKPTEIVGSNALGFLPGGLDEKLFVYMDSFVSVCSDIVERPFLNQMIASKDIEYKPVQFMRGATFKNCIVIVDEFQSFDIKELMAIVTRFGENCKMIFIGDVNQNDIDKKYVAVSVFQKILIGIEGVVTFEFERKDIVRDPMLIEITDRYEKLKDNGELTLNKKNT